jgi:hypothetical protein
MTRKNDAGSEDVLKEGFETAGQKQAGFSEQQVRRSTEENK